MVRDKAAIAAAAGIVVIIHACMNYTFSNSHLTADNLLVEPAPIIAPEIECVMLTGIPNQASVVNIIPQPVSAQNP
jgi:hypothetical protein